MATIVSARRGNIFDRLLDITYSPQVLPVFEFEDMKLVGEKYAVACACERVGLKKRC
jgi:hypothetical protein